jgi:enamine deaminase RidA (YjgF/YER057c/UK114 family)
VFVSGEVVGPQGPEGENIDAFKEQSRRTFRTIGARLKALGASFQDVVMIHSYHRFSGPGFSGGKWDQFSTFSAVKDEFMPPPHPAWTAVGVAELLPGRGVIEVEMLAYAPLNGKKSR